jgi:hypothetical protein
LEQHKHPRTVLKERDARFLAEPLGDKQPAFGVKERSALGPDGLLPATVERLEQQDNNRVLFLQARWSKSSEMLPVVYTPAVGPAC